MNEPHSPRRVLHRIGALLAGILANIIPAIATDMTLAAAGVFPPLSEPGNFTTPLCLLATAYRSFYGIAGGYITALLAPDHPMGHALVLGALGLAACVAGAVAMWGVGPAWYPVALVALAMPCAWAGGETQSHATIQGTQMNKNTNGRYATVNGLKMYHEIRGTGKPLILLHGGVGASEMFSPVVPILSQSRQVITIGLQGHGRTADIDRPLRFEVMADDVAALMRPRNQTDRSSATCLEWDLALESSEAHGSN